MVEMKNFRMNVKKDRVLYEGGGRYGLPCGPALVASSCRTLLCGSFRARLIVVRRMLLFCGVGLVLFYYDCCRLVKAPLNTLLSTR